MLMMTPMTPIRRADANPYGVSVWVATQAMDTQITSAMVPLTAGSVASSKWISILLKALGNVC